HHEPPDRGLEERIVRRPLRADPLRSTLSATRVPRGRSGRVTMYSNGLAWPAGSRAGPVDADVGEHVAWPRGIWVGGPTHRRAAVTQPSVTPHRISAVSTRDAFQEEVWFEMVRARPGIRAGPPWRSPSHETPRRVRVGHQRGGGPGGRVWWQPGAHPGTGGLGPGHPF